MRYFVVLLAFITNSAFGLCGQINIATSASVPAHNNNSTSLNYLNPYGPSETTWSFPVLIPQDSTFYVTDIVFSSKAVRYNDHMTWRNSAVILYGMDTIGENMPVRTFATPLILPGGFTISGTFSNNSPETQNMIVRIHGYMRDASCPDYRP